MFHPWGLTYRTPVWGLAHIYPLTNTYEEHWLGLKFPPPGRPQEESPWVDLGPDQPFQELTRDDHPKLDFGRMDRLLATLLGLGDPKTRRP
jgi:hypothetical protein